MNINISRAKMGVLFLLLILLLVLLYMNMYYFAVCKVFNTLTVCVDCLKGCNALKALAIHYILQK